MPIFTWLMQVTIECWLTWLMPIFTWLINMVKHLWLLWPLRMRLNPFCSPVDPTCGPFFQQHLPHLLTIWDSKIDPGTPPATSHAKQTQKKHPLLHGEICHGWAATMIWVWISIWPVSTCFYLAMLQCALAIQILSLYVCRYSNSDKRAYGKDGAINSTSADPPLQLHSFFGGSSRSTVLYP